MQQSFIVLDIETTGINPCDNKITEIGAVKIRDWEVVDTFKQLINPNVIIPQKITEITGITNEMVSDKPFIDEVMPSFIEFCSDDVIVGHNIMFDYRFLKVNATNCKYSYEKTAIDTLAIARSTLQELKSRSLESLCRYYSIVRLNSHRAYDDALATFKLLRYLYDDFYDGNEELFIPTQLIYSPPKTSPITWKQLKYLKALLHQHKMEIEENPEDLTKSQASKYIDQILHKYGRKTS